MGETGLEDRTSGLSGLTGDENRAPGGVWGTGEEAPEECGEGWRREPIKDAGGDWGRGPGF